MRQRQPSSGLQMLVQSWHARVEETAHRLSDHDLVRVRDLVTRVSGQCRSDRTDA